MDEDFFIGVTADIAVLQQYFGEEKKAEQLEEVVVTGTREAEPLKEKPLIGSYGWYRLLASGGNTWGNNGFRLDLN